MLLFLAAVAARGTDGPGIDVKSPLDRLALATGYFGEQTANVWRDGPFAIGTITHAPVSIGRARHVVTNGRRLAAFAGRPIRVHEDGTADGRACLDASTYLAPFANWETQLDGRFAVLVADAEERALRVVTDPLGQYTVYIAKVDGTTLVSNNARLLADLTGGGIRLDVAACALAGEFAPDALPLWEGVEALRPGSTHLVRPGSHDVEERWRPALLDLFAGRGRFADPVEEGARRLAVGARALADWPDRPSVVPLSGGRDSRLVLAAFHGAGVDADVRTIAFSEAANFPETADVRIARQVAEATGSPHRVVSQDIPESYVSEIDRFSWVAPGTVSIRLTQPVQPAPAGQPLELLHSGQNGEWMRALYGGGTTRGAAEREARAELLHRVPLPLVSDDAYAMARDRLRRSFDELVEYGFSEHDLPDAFMAIQDVPTYGPPSHRIYEYRYDTTFPTCTMLVAPAVLGRPPHERARGDIGERMAVALASALRDVAYDHQHHPSVLPEGVQRARRLTGKVTRELRRRGQVVRDRRAGTLPKMPFVEVHAALSAAYGSGRSHPVLEIVHRKRLERALRRDPWMISPPERRAIFMLATWVLASPR